MKIEVRTVRRLGPVPRWRGERRVQDQLEEIYRKAVEKANSALDGRR